MSSPGWWAEHERFCPVCDNAFWPDLPEGDPLRGCEGFCSPACYEASRDATLVEPKSFDSEGRVVSYSLTPAGEEFLSRPPRTSS